ncbi:U4/U6-U5 snRNP complex subunit SPP381 NDAI_0A06970 [Naumovozyma dairenensis CBS 421]|uniref:Micro-fibrillar-associated protein 1 C-terminal domain-containing protein n=1 Tax=Naumovozyma dairenensis (strain ATCC 10597 / BCRC 20456 / CBS 421 / NBRC 0211 / NRRL Y-12639) TaxID=1071378 RepID=G0W4W3_NAUDC|nr:hypothetical protein NDAI_0A06970 [Naumovozyma dairenensis CBS 421]CCD22851.1 hypothetical protein NDAI_0A06970 [Naumovozyma dairenensis CBS 421]
MSSNNDATGSRTTLPTKSVQQEKVASELENISSSSETSSSEESDSSDDEIVLHRPVFLNRKSSRKGDEEDTKKSNGNKKLKIDDGTSKAKLLKERAEAANRLLDTQNRMKLIVDSNYSTDQDILRRTLLLNDDDSIDPEGEKELWIVRRNERIQRHREKLIAKQLELEEYETNKMLNSK